MKIKDLQEAKLAPTNRNEVVAKWLARSVNSSIGKGPHKLFIDTALDIEVGGGLSNAVKAIQEWNIVAKFIHDNSDLTPIMLVSPHDLNRWVEEFKDNQ